MDLWVSHVPYAAEAQAWQREQIQHEISTMDLATPGKKAEDRKLKTATTLLSDSSVLNLEALSLAQQATSADESNDKTKANDGRL